MKQLNKNQFAKFIIDESQATIKNYLFDIFYDIRSIMEMNRIKEKEILSEISTKPVYTKCTWYIRENGSYLLLENDSNNLEITYDKNSQKKYILKFCVNSDYFSSLEYCTVKEINLTN